MMEESEPFSRNACPVCDTALPLNGLCPVCLLKAMILPETMAVDDESAFDAAATTSLAPDQLSHSTVSPGTSIGPFRLVSVLGSGGFGDVFLADQESPVKRQVALKVIKPGMDSREIVSRFEAERQILAMMDHPNIAHVFDAGTSERGLPYFVMELVTGLPITKYCDKNQLSVRQRLELFLQVCAGIQHAHQKGIVHRDLKPANILITESDGEPLAKIIDFGIAKALHVDLTEATFFTADGQIIGTPQYMSPEQINGSSANVDTRSDIYSLGIILYELLTGQTPISYEELIAAGFFEVVRLICEKDAPHASVCIRRNTKETAAKIAERRSVGINRLLREVRGELDCIVHKAVEKDPDRRYETASAFADDVRRFLNHQTVAARPPTLSYLFRKFARRNKLAITAAGLIFLVLMAGIAVSSAFGLKAQRSAAEASDARQVAEWESSALRARAQSETDGWRALRDMKSVIDQFRRTYPDRDLTPAMKEALASVLDRSRETCVKKIHAAEVLRRMVLLGDGRTIAHATQKELWSLNLHDSGSVHLASLLDEVFIEDISRAGKAGEVAVAFSDGKVSIYQAANPVPVTQWSGCPEGSVRFIRYADSPEKLVTLGIDSVVRFWSLEGLPQGEPISLATPSVSQFDTDSSGRTIALVSALGEGWEIVRIAPSGKPEVETHQTQGSPPSSIALSSDGRSVAVGFQNGSIELWREGRLIRALAGHIASIVRLEFSAGGERLSSSDKDGEIRYWACDSGKLAAPLLKGHRSIAIGLETVASNRYLISADVRGYVRVWDLLGLQARPPLIPPRDGRLSSMQFGKMENHLIVATDRDRLSLWDWEKGEVVTDKKIRISGHGMVTNHDRSLAAFLDSENDIGVEIFRTESLETVAAFPDLTAQPKTIVFHESRNWLYVLTLGGELWRAKEEEGWKVVSLGKPGLFPNNLFFMKGPGREAPGIISSADLILSFSEDGKVQFQNRFQRVRDPNSRGGSWSRGSETYFTLRRPFDDGRLVLMRIRENASEILAEVQAFNDGVYQTAFIPATRNLAGADRDGRFLLLADDDRLSTVLRSDHLMAHAASDVAAHPSLDIVAVGTRFENIYFWGTSPARWENLLSQRVDNRLPEDDREAAGFDFTSTHSPSYPVQSAIEQGTVDRIRKDTMVSAPLAGLNIQAHSNWTRIPSLGLNLVTSLVDRAMGPNFDEIFLQGVYSRNEDSPLSILEKVLVLEIPYTKDPEKIPELIGEKYGFFIDKFNAPSAFGGVLRFDPDSVNVEWLPDVGQLELRCDGWYSGSTPIQMQMNWRPTHGAALYLLGFSRKVDGKSGPLLAEMRDQLARAEVLPANQVDVESFSLIEQRARSFAGLSGSQQIWETLLERARGSNRQKAMAAAKEAVAFAVSYENSENSDEQILSKRRSLEARWLLVDCLWDLKDYAEWRRVRKETVDLSSGIFETRLMKDKHWLNLHRLSEMGTPDEALSAGKMLVEISDEFRSRGEGEDKVYWTLRAIQARYRFAGVIEKQGLEGTYQIWDEALAMAEPFFDPEYEKAAVLSCASLAEQVVKASRVTEKRIQADAEKRIPQLVDKEVTVADGEIKLREYLSELAEAGKLLKNHNSVIGMKLCCKEASILAMLNEDAESRKLFGRCESLMNDSGKNASSFPPVIRAHYRSYIAGQLATLSEKDHDPDGAFQRLNDAVNYAAEFKRLAPGNRYAIRLLASQLARLTTARFNLEGATSETVSVAIRFSDALEDVLDKFPNEGEEATVETQHLGTLLLISRENPSTEIGELMNRLTDSRPESVCNALLMLSASDDPETALEFTRRSMETALQVAGKSHGTQALSYQLRSLRSEIRLYHIDIKKTSEEKAPNYRSEIISKWDRLVQNYPADKAYLDEKLATWFNQCEYPVNELKWNEARDKCNLDDPDAVLAAKRDLVDFTKEQKMIAKGNMAVFWELKAIEANLILSESLASRGGLAEGAEILRTAISESRRVQSPEFAALAESNDEKFGENIDRLIHLIDRIQWFQTFHAVRFTEDAAAALSIAVKVVEIADRKLDTYAKDDTKSLLWRDSVISARYLAADTYLRLEEREQAEKTLGDGIDLARKFFGENETKFRGKLLDGLERKIKWSADSTESELTQRIQVLEEFISLNDWTKDQPVEMLRDLAQDYRKIGDVDKALTAIERLKVELANPVDESEAEKEFWFSCRVAAAALEASIYHDRGRTEDAIAIFRKSIDFNQMRLQKFPDSSDNHKSLGKDLVDFAAVLEGPDESESDEILKLLDRAAIAFRSAIERDGKIFESSSGSIAKARDMLLRLDNRSAGQSDVLQKLEELLSR